MDTLLPIEDRGGPAVVVEPGPRELRVAMEVLEPPHLRPRGVDAERDDREQQVDDPDAEVLAAGADEAKGQAVFAARDGCLIQAFLPGALPGPW